MSSGDAAKKQFLEEAAQAGDDEDPFEARRRAMGLASNRVIDREDEVRWERGNEGPFCWPALPDAFG